MTKQDYIQIVKTVTVITLILLLGSYLGVQKYKQSCEPIMNAQMTQKWLECND